MENKQIKELMNAMARTGTRRLVLKREGNELELERVEVGVQIDSSHASDRGSANPMREEIEQHRHSISPSKHAESAQNNEDSSKPEVSGHVVTSPMVGTFYTKSSPDADQFVSVGDLVEPNTVICIIEAMKVMNEVKAGVSGKVVDISIKNGDPVEFGTSLFVIK